MIYSKDAAFPYPILSRTSSSYQKNYFDFKVSQIEETEDSYIFPFEYKISTPFIEQLLKEKKAAMIFIVQSGDNYFERIEYGENAIKLSKKRLSLSKRTKLQLHIQTVEEINFKEATDLSVFYHELRDKIIVKKNSLLGYSDEVVFEGDEIKSVDLFEQSINPNLEVPFKVELTSEIIKLVFRDKQYNFSPGNMRKSIRNMYFYIGLNRALVEFIQEHGKDEEFISLTEMQEPEKDLHIKLKELMLHKNITELDLESLDIVIQRVSDGIIEKFVEGVKELAESGS